MRELARTHWIGGTAVSIAGALAYRLGPSLTGPEHHLTVRLAGLVLVSVGLFWIARGVSRAAAERDED